MINNFSANDFRMYLASRQFYEKTGALKQYDTVVASLISMIPFPLRSAWGRKPGELGVHPNSKKTSSASRMFTNPAWVKSGSRIRTKLALLDTESTLPITPRVNGVTGIASTKTKTVFVPTYVAAIG